MPDNNDTTENKGLLYYDASCEFCRASIRRIRPILESCEVGPTPFSDGGAETEMRLVWKDGREFGGADAVIFLSGQLWWARPLQILASLPGVLPLARAIYRRIAARRHCLGGACTIGTPPRKTALPIRWGWMVTALLVLVAVVASGLLFPEPRNTAPWWCMWMIALAWWLGFKFIAASRTVPRPHVAFLFWPGMDAGNFVARIPTRSSTSWSQWIQAIPFLLFGLLLVPYLSPFLIDQGHITLSGAMGMAGIVASLHFGLFAWMAIAWHRIGFPAAPLMRTPWRATGLTDFWGERWNRGFSDIARIAIFRPLVRRFGAAVGTLAGFLLSGIAHETVISLPARAGWGLPTAYFLIQGIGLLIERRWLTSHPRLRRAIAWLLVLGPAPLLFPPVFLERVIVPGFLGIHTFIFQ